MEVATEYGSPVSFEVTWGKQVLQIETRSSSTFQDLKRKIEEVTDVPVEGQKILFKQAGVKKPASDADRLETFLNGNSQPVKIMLLGSKREEIAQIQSQKAPVGTFDRPKAKAPAARDTREIGRLSDSGFLDFQVLPLPRKEDAMKLLHKLASDAGIAYVMKKYGFKVGVLTELSPAVSDKLGFNRGRGIEISLRLRIDDGFRAYHLIRETLVHELAHMHWDEHDHRFHAFNRQLLKESGTGGGQRLGGERIHDPEEEEQLEHSNDVIPQRLGGSAIPSDLPMRELLYQAAVLRLSAREQELVDHCGQPSSSPSSAAPLAKKPAEVVKPIAAPPVAKAAPKAPTKVPAPPSTPFASPLAAVGASVPVTAPPQPECPICGMKLTPGASERDLSRHVDECLQKGMTSVEVQTPAVAPAATTDLDVQSRATTSCPICGKVFSGVSNRTINNHIDECLKSMS